MNARLGAGIVATVAAAAIALALASPPTVVTLPPPTTAVGTVVAVSATRPQPTRTPAPTRPRVGPASAYPDPLLTPGAVLPVSAAEVCTPGYAGRARNVSQSVKSQVFARYGIPQDGTLWEIDHFEPLELGGSNDVTNLWPQPWNGPGGAHQKDVVENYLAQAVCKGRLSLAEAQAAIRADWVAVYEAIRRGQP